MRREICRISSRAGLPTGSPHRTRDDLHTTLGITLTRSWGKGKKLRLILRNHTYALNPQKSYTFFRLEGEAQKGPIRLRLYGYGIPAYLVRYFPELDSTPVRWRPAYYRSTAIGAYGRWRVGRRLWLTLEGRGKWWDYVPQFNEYDTWALWGQIRMSVSRAGVGLGVERAWARATDEPGETPLTSDDPDYSYVAYEGVGWLRLRERPEIMAEGYGRLRWFVTAKPFERDPYHVGRKDRDFRLTLRIRIPVNRRLSLSGRYRLELRRTTSPAFPEIFEVKSYNRHRFSLGFQALL